MGDKKEAENVCEGYVDDYYGKCDGKKDVCCFAGVPSFTGEPEINCEDLGGECMDKKEAKEGCGGYVEDFGKCQGEKDVCCIAGGPAFTGEPEGMKCEEDMGGQCMNKKEAKDGCDGYIEEYGDCKGKKDVCCIGGGPAFTGEPEGMMCEEDMGGKCMNKKEAKDGCDGYIEKYGDCKGKKDVCCMGGGPAFTGEPEGMMCEEDMGGKCMNKKEAKDGC